MRLLLEKDTESQRLQMLEKKRSVVLAKYI